MVSESFVHRSSIVAEVLTDLRSDHDITAPGNKPCLEDATIAYIAVITQSHRVHGRYPTKSTPYPIPSRFLESGEGMSKGASIFIWG